MLYVIFLCLFCLPATLWAQGRDSASATISGRVVDNSGEPLSAANVTICDFSTDHVITGTSTDGRGFFEIRVQPGRYILKIAFISYEPYQQNIFADRGINKDLGIIKLQLNTNTLGQIIVRAKQSRMTLGFDKRIFNVGRDVTDMGGSAVNVLRNVPSVSVDINGNISLRGNQSVRILINGHPSALASNGIQALRSIPANMIRKIEVITNPSSKYSAQGTGGIINIVLVKDRRLGFNGSVAVNTGYPQNHAISANLNYQKGNFNWFANLSTEYEAEPEAGHSFQRYSGPDTSYMYQEKSASNKKKFKNTFRLGTDWYLSKTQTITANTDIKLEWANTSDHITYTNLAYSPGAFDGKILKREFRANKGNIGHYDYDFYLRYKDRIDGDRQKLTASAYFGIKHKPIHTGIKESVLQGSGAPGRQRSGSGEQRNRYRLDITYRQPLGNTGKLETGLRSHTAWYDLSQSVEGLNGGEWTSITSYNGSFLYRGNVNAAYLILGFKPGRFSGEFGGRLENTRIRTEVKGSKKVNTQNYINFFPSVFLNYAFTPKSSIQISYSRRIRRPEKETLLPFSEYSNSRRQTAGNPNLSPEFSNSLEAGYLRTWESGSLLTGFYYRHRSGVIEYITEHQQDNLVRFPINLSTEKGYGIEFTAQQNLLNGLNLQGNLNFYRLTKNGQYRDQVFGSEVQSFLAKINIRWDFLGSWHYQASFRYRGPRHTTQGRRDGSISMDTGISHDLWEGKAQISLGIHGLFNSRDFKNILTDDGIPNTDFYYRRSYRFSERTFLLSFRYFFHHQSNKK